LFSWFGFLIELAIGWLALLKNWGAILALHTPNAHLSACLR
jgi:hypothetical protein